ncbi:TonB-dependent receptor [Sphingomonas sp. CL5.1]|uniref:TonB-dependent receptor n=1 Tax=Sphingomonas sp. CL5.1 TaxID=2653203 RepID=UPI001582D734|nr:TonB-dependent receptor [Sphingomonas sp. CL5.1]QKR99797.1 TonB-dependent receptor [Sphingomonas sp. CL5.1]
MSASRKALFLISTMTLSAPATAWAQDRAPADQSAPAQGEPAQAGLQEVVVTAQQRGENLQKAAVPVAVVSGDDLLNSGIRGIDTLGKLVPSLVVAAGGQGNLIFIRGVGNFSFVASSDPAAAYNFDGVYVGRSSATFGTFYDLERVEVLKGPQGTLYGRNATAGALNILPVQPRLGENSGYASASYGSHNEVQAEGAVNVGLGENAAFRLSGLYTHHDGYLRDGTQTDDSAGVRAQLKVALTPSLTVRIEGDYAQQRGVGGGSDYVARYALNPLTGQFVATPSGLPLGDGLFTPEAQAYRAANGTAGRLAGRFLDPLANRPFQRNDVYGIATHIDWKTPIGTFSIIPAWRHARKDNLNTESAQQVGNTQDANQYSVEARLVGSSGRLVDYILGAYYFSEQIDDDVHNSAGSVANFNKGRFTTHSPSFYGRLTLHATDWLRFTGGARYTEDHKRYFDAVNTALSVVCTVPAACPTAPLLPYTRIMAQQPFVPAVSGSAVVAAPGVLVSRSDTFPGGALNTSKVTYRAAVEIDAGPRSLLYASVESGYRAGGFNAFNAYNPENITAYTIGSKNRFLDNRLQLNVEAFYWKYKDQQLTYFGIDPTGRLGIITANVGKSTIKGVEVEGRALVTPTTMLNANVQYLDAGYDRFTYLSPAPVFTGCPVTPSGALYQVNCSGRPALNSPKWTVNLGVRQTIPLGGNQLVLDADTQYRSGRYTGFDYIPQEYVDHSWVSNASISFGMKDGKYVIGAFVRNIENNRPQVYGTTVPASNLIVSIIAPPRTYGVRLSTKF